MNTTSHPQSLMISVSALDRLQSLHDRLALLKGAESDLLRAAELDDLGF